MRMVEEDSKGFDSKISVDDRKIVNMEVIVMENKSKFPQYDYPSGETR